MKVKEVSSEGISAGMIEMVKPRRFETRNGGLIIMGECLHNGDHLIVIAHIDAGDAADLAAAIEMISRCDDGPGH